MRIANKTLQALGGDIVINLVGDRRYIEHLLNDVVRYIYNFERQFSRFLPASELTEFNRQAGMKARISPALRDLLLAAKEYGEETGGLYNPFILPALQRSGYLNSASAGYEDDPVPDFRKRRVASVEQLKITDNWALIPYGTALDLGGCGKGYLADKLAQLLDHQAVEGYLVSLGGDIISYGHDNNGQNWQLFIQDAGNLEEHLPEIVECPNNFLATATSGTFRRQGHKSKVGWHHILDSETLKPATTDIRLATICADKAIKADVLASCSVILGTERTPGFLKRNGVRNWCLQTDAGHSFEGNLIKSEAVHA